MCDGARFEETEKSMWGFVDEVDGDGPRATPLGYTIVIACERLARRGRGEMMRGDDKADCVIVEGIIHGRFRGSLSLDKYIG